MLEVGGYAGSGTVVTLRNKPEALRRLGSQVLYRFLPVVDHCAVYTG